MWPKLGQRPILTPEMLLLIGPNMFLAKGNTLVTVLTLGQTPIEVTSLFLDFEENSSLLATFCNFVESQFGHMLANDNFLGQIWPEMKAGLMFWPGKSFSSCET